MIEFRLFQNLLHVTAAWPSFCGALRHVSASRCNWIVRSFVHGLLKTCWLFANRVSMCLVLVCFCIWCAHSVFWWRWACWPYLYTWRSVCVMLKPRKCCAEEFNNVNVATALNQLAKRPVGLDALLGKKLFPSRSDWLLACLACFGWRYSCLLYKFTSEAWFILSVLSCPLRTVYKHIGEPHRMRDWRIGKIIPIWGFETIT